MNTSKYDTETRKHLKRFQRSPGYQAVKQEHLAQREKLESAHRAAREKLESALRDRDKTIMLLREKLVELGIAIDEVAKLPAA